MERALDVDWGLHRGWGKSSKCELARLIRSKADLSIPDPLMASPVPGLDGMVIHVKHLDALGMSGPMVLLNFAESGVGVPTFSAAPQFPLVVIGHGGPVPLP